MYRVFTEHYLPKRNTYHNLGDVCWAKQTEEETPEKFWRRLIEIEKECKFSRISAEELLTSKYMTAITDKKLRDKMMKGKTLELKKNNRTNKAKHIQKEEQGTYDTGSIDFGKERHTIKEEPIRRMERFGARPKTKTTWNRPCRLCGAPKWTQLHKCPAKETNCNKCGRKEHYAKVCRQKYTNN